jgi:putative membrane protein
MPLALHQLPALNACLNASCALLLLAGFFFIKKKNVFAHRVSMGLAFGVSIVFLCSYLYYHAHAGMTRYQGQGVLRAIYFSILISHTILAALIAPLACVTLAFALRGRFDRHAQLARWTWPIWMYVSVTGVIIYLMLYQL